MLRTRVLSAVMLLSGCGGKLAGVPELLGAYSATDAAGASVTVGSAELDASSEPVPRLDGGVVPVKGLDAGTVAVGSVFDGGALGEDGGLGYPSWAAPCLGGGNVFYTDGQDYPGLSGMLKHEGGEWSEAPLGTTWFELDDQQPDGGTWSLSVSNGVQEIALTPGTYTSNGDNFSTFASVSERQTEACAQVPTGTFTIADLAWTDVAEPAPSRLLMWFDLTCPAGGGTVVGCVSYQE